MYCPVCRAEQKSGRSDCPDCHAVLVERPPRPGTPPIYRELWRGEDPRTRQAVGEELDRAGILYAESPAPLSFLRYGNPLDWSPKALFGFVISVKAEELPSAEAIRDRVVGRTGSGSKSGGRS